MSEPQYDTEDMAQIGIYDSLRTEIERLRAALERTRPHVRNEIIEECALVADADGTGRGWIIAAAIRALKEKV